MIILFETLVTSYFFLGYLRALPFDTLKIARSLVVEIVSGRGDLFAETTVSIARKLGVCTIAEGVESDSQLSRLRELGCDIVQGFLYARPMPGDALEAWIASRPAGEARHGGLRQTPAYAAAVAVPVGRRIMRPSQNHSSIRGRHVIS